MSKNSTNISSKIFTTKLTFACWRESWAPPPSCCRSSWSSPYCKSRQKIETLSHFETAKTIKLSTVEEETGRLTNRS